MPNHDFHDPDFDQPKNKAKNTEKKYLLEQVPPQTLFIIGLITGIMTLCTIGFFVLLSILLKG